MSRYHNLKVFEVVRETQDATSILFQIPNELKNKFRYSPGQFITLRFAYKGEEIQRCYSMSSTPELDEFLRVTVKRVKKGKGSNWVCDNLLPGVSVDVMQPAGLFTSKDLMKDHLLYAGGSGITPVFSILRDVLNNGTGRVRLIYANRDEASVIFKQTIKELAAQFQTRFEVVHLLESLQGIPTLHSLSSLAGGMQDPKAFICGPGPFMDAVEKALQTAGIPEENIKIERFVFAKKEGENKEQTHQQSDVKRTSPNELEQTLPVAAQIELEIDGVQHTINCKSGQTILDAAESIGIELPYSCREGMCASCMCEITKGDVQLLNNDVLDQKDLDNKLILTCQAVPLSEHIKVKYT